MLEVLSHISQLKDIQKKIFFEIVFYEQNKENYLLGMLKNLSEEAKKDFFKDSSDDVVEWWEEQLNKLPKDIDYSTEEFKNKARDEMRKIVNQLDSRIEKLRANTDEVKVEILKRRELMKGYSDDKIYEFLSDQNKGEPYPPVEKEYESDAFTINLPDPDKSILNKSNLFDCIAERKSHRLFQPDQLSIRELSFLLWATQGVRDVIRDGKITLRNVPSGGARQPFETYIAVNAIQGLNPGVYRYLPLEHKLLYLFFEENMVHDLNDAACGQKFVGNCAVCFIWSAVPYRTEWRYGPSAFKDILIEAGHVCQNLYIAAEAINCGTCAICAYEQEKIDKFLRLDGKDEYVVYLAPVGKV